jgi:hypothetical protein
MPGRGVEKHIVGVQIPMCHIVLQQVFQDFVRKTGQVLADPDDVGADVAHGIGCVAPKNTASARVTLSRPSCLAHTATKHDLEGSMKRIILGALLLLLSAPVGAQTTFFSENFEGTVEPTLPTSVATADASWKTASSSASPGSGGNNAVHTGVEPGSLVFGPIDLTAALDGTFSYWARRTSSYSADSLIVRASLDGMSFDVLLFGGGLPAAASAWEEISVVLPASLLGAGTVWLQFDGRGGSSSGSNMRIDDVLIEGTANPLLIDTAFGFGANTLLWDLSAPSLGVDLGIEWAGPDTLQGLQFSLSWDDAVVSVDSVSLGAGLGSPSSWMLSSSLGPSTGNISLLSISNNGLPPVMHSSVLVLHVSAVAPVAVTTDLVISGFLATSNTPTADELGLPNGHRTLSLTLQPSLASAIFSSTSLDFGSVAVGDSSLISLDVSNPTGTADLTLTGSASPLFLTLPAPIPPAASTSLQLRYRPSLSEGGSPTGSFILTHNTAAASTAFSWTALVLGGRGDTDGDGSFDVADLVLSLDGTVYPGLIPAAELPRHDLYPFPDGDGALDIRDLTVAIQAILRGQWPDASPLPLAPSSGSPGKGLEIVLVQTADSLWLASPIPLRGAQLTLISAEPLPVVPPAKRGALLSEYFDPTSNQQRILLLAGPGAAFDEGNLPVAALPEGSRPPSLPDELRLSAGVAVDRFGGKHPVIFRREGGLPELPEPELDTFGVYPNPSPLGSPVHLDLPPLDLSSLELFDTLGRRLFLQHERTRVLPAELFRTPGTYFVRIAAGSQSLTRSLIIVR